MSSGFFLGPDTPVSYTEKITTELLAFLITPEEASRQFKSYYGPTGNIDLVKFYTNLQNGGEKGLSKSQKTRQININRNQIERLKKEGKYSTFIK